MSATCNALRFMFPGTFRDGTVYDVAIVAQPTGQLCQLENGSGTIQGANVTNIAVTCGPAP